MRYVCAARLAVLMAVLFVVAPVRAAEELSDLAARLQFHYYAADSRGLGQALDALKRLQVNDNDAPLRSYYLAYGFMSLSKAISDADKSESRKAAGECERYAEEVLDRPRPRASGAERARIDTLYGELWAIKAACTGGSLLQSSAKARETAQSLAPQSPRVRLLAAIFAAERAKSARERDAAARQMQAVVESFRNQRPIGADAPDWGQAEAWAWLGRIQLQRGQLLAAREAIESALVLAPDYAWARSLRAQVLSGR